MVVIYIFIGLLALFIAFLSIIAFSPVRASVSISREAWVFRLRYLGLWMQRGSIPARSGFLRWKFGKPEKGPKEPKHADKGESKRPEKVKPAKAKVPVRFWWARRELLLDSLVVVLKTVARILKSVQIGPVSATVIAGNGDPALAGAAFGWLSALEAWLPETVALEIGYDFNPFAEWECDLDFRLSDTAFRAAICPLCSALWELPKIKLFRLYRDYKRITRPSERTGAEKNIDSDVVGVVPA